MRRRSFMSVVATSLAIFPAIARAQTTAIGDCTVGFVNGLLQFSPDCTLLTPPGLDFAISPPSHLALPIMDDAATINAPESARAERIRLRRDRRQNRASRRRDRKGHRRDGRRRKSDNRRERRVRRRIPGVLCSDFSYQEDAQAFFDSDRYDGANDPDRLDRNGNGLACDHLPNKPPPAP